MGMTAEVLNGEVKTGDRVAYASKGYGNHPLINVGYVDEVFQKNGKVKIKVRIEYSTSHTGGDRWATVEVLGRVIKL